MGKSQPFSPSDGGPDGGPLHPSVGVWHGCPWSRGIPWLDFIGKYSLQVFSFHVFILYLIVPVREYIDGISGIWELTVFGFIIVVSLSIPASVFSIYNKYRKSNVARKLNVKPQC